MRTKFILWGIIALATCLSSLQAMAGQLLTITPLDYTNHEPAIGLGTTLNIPYSVTNNTPAALHNITASSLPSGVTSSTCATLAPRGGKCTLILTLPASVTRQPRIIQGQFQICTHNTSSGCTAVDLNNQLKISIKNDSTFLAITDIHLKKGFSTPITYGQDTGDQLWASTQAELQTLIAEQAPKFILLLGDLPAHRDIPNIAANIGAVLTGISNLRSINTTNTPVFYVFGNNDSLVSNYGNFSNGTTNIFSLDPAHNTAATKGWPALNANTDCSLASNTACTYSTTSPMPPQHADDMANAQTNGYYSAYPLGSATPLRLIVLNSVIFSYKSPLNSNDQTAAAQAEMDWLSNQLHNASANDEAVYIAMHIPAGDNAFNNREDMWNTTLRLNNGLKFREAYLALMTQYKNTIRAIISGHTHLNDLRALYSDNSLSNLSVLNVGVPSITPVYSNNPGMQVYLFDTTYNLVEAKTYYTTPTPSSWKNYSFQNDYNCPVNSTMLECIRTNLLSQLPLWKLAPQPIALNPYETNVSVRMPSYNPAASGNSDWLAFLNSIQIAP